MRANFQIGYFAFIFSITRVCFSQDVDDTIKFIHETWRAEQKRAIVLYFHLEESEKSAFWPIYNSYCSSIQYLEFEYIEAMSLLKNPAASENLTKEIFSSLLENELNMARYRKQYFRKFCRALSRTKAREFMTLDESMRMLFRLQLQKNNPLLEMSQEAVLHANERIFQ